MRGAHALTLAVCSIREFCALDMPIIMFDKNQDYVVLKLGQVCVRLRFPGFMDID